MVESISHTWLGSSLTTVPLPSADSWLVMESLTGSMILLQLPFRQLTTTLCTVIKCTKRSLIQDVTGSMLISTKQIDALSLLKTCSMFGNLISISTTCSKGKMVLHCLLTKTRKAKNALTLLINLNLEQHTVRVLTITLHGFRPADQPRRPVLVVMLLVLTITQLLFVQLFIFLQILHKVGRAVERIERNGHMKCLSMHLNGSGKISKQLTQKLECLSSLEIKMVPFQLQAQLTGLTLWAGTLLRHGLHGWM
jgi:hypothetical protein